MTNVTSCPNNNDTVVSSMKWLRETRGRRMNNVLLRSFRKESGERVFRVMVEIFLDKRRVKN